MLTFILGIIIVGGITTVAILGLFLIRSRYDVRKFASHHEIAGYLFAVLGTLYAVVLGFVVVGVSDSLHNDSVNIATEINSVMTIYRIAEGLPEKNKEQIDQALLGYLTAVYRQEWAAMASNKISGSTIKAQEDIWQSIKVFVPQTEQQQSFYSLILENYSRLLDCHRMRLLAAHDSVSPILWIVLISGAVSTIAFMLLFGLDRPWPQVVMMILVCVTLGLNLFLVAIYGRPFEGDLGIHPKEFEMAAEFIRNHGQIPDRFLMH